MDAPQFPFPLGLKLGFPPVPVSSVIKSPVTNLDNFVTEQPVASFSNSSLSDGFTVHHFPDFPVVRSMATSPVDFPSLRTPLFPFPKAGRLAPGFPLVAAQFWYDVRCVYAVYGYKAACKFVDDLYDLMRPFHSEARILSLTGEAMNILDAMDTEWEPGVEGLLLFRRTIDLSGDFDVTKTDFARLAK